MKLGKLLRLRPEKADERIPLPSRGERFAFWLLRRPHVLAFALLVESLVTVLWPALAIYAIAEILDCGAGR